MPADLAAARAALPGSRRARAAGRRFRRALARSRRRTPAQLRRIQEALLRRLRRVVRFGRRRWRRSMRLRVVATTMLLGLVVVVILGNFLLARIRDGLVDGRREIALAEAERLTDSARDKFEVSTYSGSSEQDVFVADLMGDLKRQSTETRGLVLRQALGSKEQSSLIGRAIGISEQAVPNALRDAVNDGPGQHAEITALPAADDPEGEPALAVGTIIDIPLSGPYELYFLYSLQREQEILDLVRRTFVVGGFALVVLVGAVAYTVTRQVVAPVRQAARTAEELASGRLDRRMKVRGEDDMARLGRAFNEMAAGLERQIHRLEELSRVQRRFVSDVSHELRTPLTTIRMASEVLYESRADLDPVLARSAELLQAQLDRFEALLGDLLEISRFDAGAAVLELEPTDIREVVGQVVDVLAPLAERRGSLVRVVAPFDACIAEIDPRRVQRIVRNLLANAIEHGEGRPIDVRIAASVDAVAVGVLDHGVGLQAPELAMVFSRFWRADPARARSTGGTGLGLAIAQEDAHLHGGWLQAWGEPDVGANFRLTLPRRRGLILINSPLPLVPYGRESYVREPAAVLDDGVAGPSTGQFALPVMVVTSQPEGAEPEDPVTTRGPR